MRAGSAAVRQGDGGVRGAVGAVVLAVASAAVGIGLAVVVAPFEELAPLVFVGVPALGIMVAATFRRPLVGAIALLLTFPFGAVSIDAGPADLQVVELAVVAVAAIIALRRLASGTTMLPWTPQLWWMLGLVGWTLIALPSALDQELAIKQIAQLAGGILFACLIVAACKSMDDVRILMTAFVLVGVGVAVVALASGGQLEASYSASVVEGRAEGTFDQPNLLGSFCAVAAVVATGLALGARGNPARVALVVALGFIAAAMLLSLSRGAWIGAAAATAFMALALRRSRRLVLAVGLPLLLAAALAGTLAPTNPQIQIVGQRIESLTVLSPYDDRPAIWREAVMEIRADPWTGQGPGSFPVASARATSEATTTSAEHAHNLWLTWTAESGIPATAFIIGFMISLAFAAKSAGSSLGHRDRNVVVALAAALVAIAGQGLVDYPMRNAVIFFATWTVVGALLASWRIARASIQLTSTGELEAARPGGG